MLIIFLIGSIVVSAQESKRENKKNRKFTQTIRGSVIDDQTKITLPGANIVVANSDPLIGTVTDLNGSFMLENVSVGRHNLVVSYMGYKTITIPNLIITSAKEFIVDIKLQEEINTLEEVKVIAHNKKDALNNASTVSARSFTIEETLRYAGSMGDPSKMAANYGGVVSVDDGRNDIIIRGNAPSGLLWKLEGITIPNPNHFSTYGTTGGPVPILNQHNLTNSDFFTGAFPAEYGNATAGVFDLRMRNGNHQKHEFTVQLSFMGIELGIEGPITKKSKSSYLFNYRYSTLGLLNNVGLIGDNDFPAIPKYQDLNFKILLPKTKAGQFSLFGIGGLANLDYKYIDQEDDDYDTHDESLNLNSRMYSNMGVLGLSHLKLFSRKSYLKTVIAYTGIAQGEEIDTVISPAEIQRIKNGKGYESIFILNSFYSHKLNKKNNFKIGLSLNYSKQFYADSILEETNTFRNILSSEGNYMLASLYGQWQHKFSDKALLNAGVHSQYLTFNNTYSVEPRLGFKVQPNKKHAFSIGAGLHSQTQTLMMYLYETQLLDGTYLRTNTDLEMTKSIHLIAAYDYSPTNNLRFKIEPYYQHLYDVPVEKGSTSFSALNIGADFLYPVVENLENTGVGRNYGVDLTIEKFFSKRYYFLMTTSLYDSKYKGSDGVERNTVFNGNFSLTALGGVEIKLGKFSALLVDAKVCYSGNRRYLPVDLPASETAGYPVYNYDQAYTKRLKDYFKTDIKLSLRWNRKKTTHYIVYEMMNLFNNKNVSKRIYNPRTNGISTMYQMGRFPNFIYKIEF
jgi:hypothetical protein